MKVSPLLAVVMGLVVMSSISRAATIETTFESFDGFETGSRGFAISDPNDSNFSLVGSSPGEIVFFRDPALYFNSNRAYGVISGESSTLEFVGLAAQEVTIWGQDTNNNTDNESGGVLGLAIGEIEAFDATGSLGTVAFPEGSFGAISFSSDSGITSLELRNLSNIPRSWALLGAITATSVPEPSSSFAILCGVLFLSKLRRSSRNN